MKYTALFVFMFFAASCTKQNADASQQSALEIEDADVAMSKMAQKEGFNVALLYYADSNVVKPAEGKLPIIGKQDLQKAWSKKGPQSISWAPFKVEASVAGDLGYSLGYWKMVTPDTTYNGFYYTFWKKQKDGHWKFVLDGGHNTPAPPKEMD